MVRVATINALEFKRQVDYRQIHPLDLVNEWALGQGQMSLGTLSAKPEIGGCSALALLRDSSSLRDTSQAPQRDSFIGATKKMNGTYLFLRSQIPVHLCLITWSPCEGKYPVDLNGT